MISTNIISAKRRQDPDILPRVSFAILNQTVRA
jgi:hypothetical protein